MTSKKYLCEELEKKHSKTIEDTFSLISKRFSLMKSIAHYKHLNAESVYIPSREIDILHGIKFHFASIKLPINAVLGFAQIQMDLSKHIETYWIRLWESSHSLFKKDSKKNYSIEIIRKEINNLDKHFYSKIEKLIFSMKFLSKEHSYLKFKFALKNIIGVPKKIDYIDLLFETLFLMTLF